MYVLQQPFFANILFFEPYLSNMQTIIRLIEMSAENAHKHGAWIGICGELAADITLTEAFLRMGIDELSVSPHFVLKVRDTVRKIDLSKQCKNTFDLSETERVKGV